MWERSTHAKKLDATLNETCRMITGCLKPTNNNSLPVLTGIAPSDTRRAVACRTERPRQASDERHPLNGHLAVVPHLKSRKSFMTCTKPINTTAKAARLELWRHRHEPLDARVHLDISADEHLAPSWRRESLCNLQGTQPVEYTGWPVKSEHVEVGDFPTNQKPVIVASARQTMQHLLVCPMMDTACSPQDLTTANDIAIGCARHWEDTIGLTYDSWWKDKNDDDY